MALPTLQPLGSTNTLSFPCGKGPAEICDRISDKYQRYSSNVFFIVRFHGEFYGSNIFLFSLFFFCISLLFLFVKFMLKMEMCTTIFLAFIGSYDVPHL